MLYQEKSDIFPVKSGIFLIIIICNFIEDLYERVNESNSPKTIF